MGGGEIMTLITHTIVGLGLSAIAPQHAPTMWVAFSILPDIDHIASIKQWRFKVGGFRSSRTVLHELLGAVIWALIGLLLAFWNISIASVYLVSISVHLFLDFISGYSVPFRGIGNEQSVDFGESIYLRIAQEIAIDLISLLAFVSRYWL